MSLSSASPKGTGALEASADDLSTTTVYRQNLSFKEAPMSEMIPVTPSPDVREKLVEALQWFIDNIDGWPTTMADFNANVTLARQALSLAKGEK